MLLVNLCVLCSLSGESTEGIESKQGNTKSTLEAPREKAKVLSITQAVEVQTWGKAASLCDLVMVTE